MSEQQLYNDIERIAGLFFRQLHDELELHEQIELDQYLESRDPETREYFQQMVREEEIGQALQFMYAIDENAALGDVQMRIQSAAAGSGWPAMSVVAGKRQGLPTDQAEEDTAATAEEAPIVLLPDRPRSGRTGRRIAAAAAILLIVGGPLYYYFSGKKAPEVAATAPAAARFKNEVAPGGDKAILQLADGSRIVLDSASNGKLAEQGKTQVIKLDDGQLAYHAAKAGAEGVSFNTISTPKGGQYQIVLPDGSKVWLNAASSIRFPTSFTGEDRSVELHGEAYFDVAKDAVRPFKVTVVRDGNGQIPLQISVLGTEFNVMAYGDERENTATLISGAIWVGAAGQDKLLKPGQQINISQRSNTLSNPEEADVEEAAAWKEGRFQFKDATIEDIMRQVARWYDVEVTYRGKINQEFVGKIPRSVSITTLLTILEATGWVHFTVDGKKITVMP